MTKVLIIDDHEIFRQGLKKIITENFQDVLFAEAGTAEEAFKLYTKENWDIVITDINLPGRSGIDIVKDLNQNHPEIPILVLSMYPEEQFAIRVIKAGASGYLSKNSALSELISAMQNLMEGKEYITESVAEV
ncbi:MAG: response regulator transcription factor, partial [Bacteroidetes bacterium]|nr:response regulator transcription factor [Bacteroidota bacterium]